MSDNPTETQDPTKVDIVKASGAPLPVEVVAGDIHKQKGPQVQNQRDDPSRPANTTFEENLMTAGQRSINVMWESTQSKIAIRVVITIVAIDGIIIILLVALGRDLTAAQALVLSFLNTIAVSIIQFYFTRTNHTKTGGVGVDDKGR